MSVSESSANPLLRPTGLFAVALSLSIGWGIRGNFGHEAGAMIAGVLSAISVAVLSGRDDWKQRVMYFAFFGGLGWGFGGSIAYMYPISFTESGHTASTYFGYAALILEGGLWCGMGAAGTALAATMPLQRLTRFFTPLLFVLAALGLRHFIEEPLAIFLSPATGHEGDGTWHRHKSPLYWFDADWLQAVMALLGVCVYDLYDRLRRPAEGNSLHPAMLVPFLLAGAVIGFVGHWLLGLAGLDVRLASALTVHLGDLNWVNPDTGGHYTADQLLTNWPQFFSDFPQHLGWVLGVIVAGIVYFVRAGRFRNDSSLLLAMSGGWLVAFLLMPTLGSLFLMEYGGLRVMPPRSDDWAGILGVFVATLIWFSRHDLKNAAHVASRGFLYGGMSFASVPVLRYLLRYPGHPWRFDNAAPEAWVHYQSANWHSVLEQLHGFGHGLAIVLAMSVLWRRQPVDVQSNPRRWTIGFAAVFTLFGIGFLNLHKLVRTWIEKDSIPEVLKAPFWEALELTPHGWFRVVWYFATAAAAILLLVHLKRPLALIPSSWTGRGQLLYLLFLWMMVIGNLMRAIPGFTDGRMVTEWMLFMNAAVATLLVVILPSIRPTTTEPVNRPRWNSLTAVWVRGLLLASLLVFAYGYTTLSLYQQHLEGKAWANHARFGPQATWRVKPILKQGEHP